MNKLCTSRWGTVLQSTVDDTRLQGLVSALVVNDIPAARVLLDECCSDGFSNKRINCGWSGVRMFPIEAVVVGAAREEEKIELATLLAKRQASMNVLWTEATGEHTPLSRALSLRQFRLAAALVACGASPATALLETSLLEATRFDPSIVRWLLNAGADVTVPPVHAPRSHCHGSAGTSSSWAVVSILAKCGLELHVLRQLHSLEAVPSCTTQEQLILQRVALILSLMLAAGAPPLRADVGTRPAPAPPADAPAFTAEALSAACGEAMQAPAREAARAAAGEGMRAVAGPTGPAPGASGAGGHGHGPSILELRPLLLGPSPQEKVGPGPPWLPGQQLLRPDSGEVPPPLNELRLSQPGPPGAAQQGSSPPPPPPPPFGFQSTEWEFLRPYATQVPGWSPHMHWLFPEPVRAAIRVLVMISSCRGFPAAGSPAAGAQAGIARTQLALPSMPSAGTALLGQDHAFAASKGAGGAALRAGAGRSTACAAGGSGGSGGVQEGGRVLGCPALPAWQQAQRQRAQQAQRQRAQQAQREGGMVWLDANVLECICRHTAKVWYQYT